jgi:RND superfamily putative drug exporter
VFGLSMDYEVFLISRIHEQWVRQGDSRRAVGEGLALTGRVVTAAAAIMICVFLSFMLGENKVIKEFGLSLAATVFLDAVIVRCLLLPAVLELLGDTTWRIPRWLDRPPPRVNIESSMPNLSAADEAELTLLASNEEPVGAGARPGSRD